MATDPQYMDLNEFKEAGFLQEVNRQFFHPLGLALAVEVDDETGDVVGFAGVWDYRDDPEGLFFLAEELDPEKAERVRDLLESKADERRRKEGAVVQPIPGLKPTPPPKPESNT